MSLALAARSTLIAPSATLAMAAEAKRLKGQGLEVLDFALGEPDFGTPANSTFTERAESPLAMAAYDARSPQNSGFGRPECEQPPPAT